MTTRDLLQIIDALEPDYNQEQQLNQTIDQLRKEAAHHAAASVLTSCPD